MATLISPQASSPFPDYARAMEHLVEVVQHLSLARDLKSIMEIVRREARLLTGADGATFVLRDGDQCFYADEDAIAPLWKGSRFPMEICVSGWVMRNRQPVVIEDICQDPRVPVEAYRDTFVRSMAMVPIRTVNPVGAIGNYWASHFSPSREQLKLLQALADTTAVAMENVQLQQELEARVRERTAQLETANHEIRQLSLKDELTGLYNRRGFVLLATQQLRVAERSHAPGWLLYADVDGLKPVNDKFGHEAGDRLIGAAAKVLRETFRGYDILARVGGDEFVVFGVSDCPPADIDMRLQQCIDGYNAQHPDEPALSMSTGLAHRELCTGVSLEEFLNDADEAMYRVKRARRKEALARAGN